MIVKHELGRSKYPWPIWRYYSRIYAERLTKITNNLTQNSWPLGPATKFVHIPIPNFEETRVQTAVPGKVVMIPSWWPSFCCSISTSSEATIYISSPRPSIDTRLYDRWGLKQMAWLTGSVQGVVVQTKANTDTPCGGMKERMASGTLCIWSRTVTALLQWAGLYSSSASARAVLWTQSAVNKVPACIKMLSILYSRSISLYCLDLILQLQGQTSQYQCHDVTFEVFTPVMIKFMVFWVVVLCSVVVWYQCFRGLCNLHLQGCRYGGSMVLQNTGIQPPHYTVQQPRKPRITIMMFVCGLFTLGDTWVALKVAFPSCITNVWLVYGKKLKGTLEDQTTYYKGETFWK